MRSRHFTSAGPFPRQSEDGGTAGGEGGVLAHSAAMRVVPGDGGEGGEGATASASQTATRASEAVRVPAPPTCPTDINGVESLNSASISTPAPPPSGMGGAAAAAPTDCLLSPLNSDSQRTRWRERRAPLITLSGSPGRVCGEETGEGGGGACTGSAHPSGVHHM